MLYVAEYSLEMVSEMPFKANRSKWDVILSKDLFVIGRLPLRYQTVFALLFSLYQIGPNHP